MTGNPLLKRAKPWKLELSCQSCGITFRATLEPRVVRNQPVYVGSRRGYSIAAREQRGLGYAVATDLDDRESAELVASIP